MIKKPILFTLIMALSILFVGCKTNEKTAVDFPLFSIDNLLFKDISIKEINAENEYMSKLNNQLTLAEALEIFGKPLQDDRNALFPIGRSWQINQSRKLTVLFDIEDREKFLSSFYNGEFALPNEDLQYDESGIRFMTENELKVLSEWLKSFKAISAYYTEDGIKYPIF